MFDGRKEKKSSQDLEKIRVGALTVFLIGILIIVVGITLIIPAFAQSVTTIQSYQTALDVFFPIPDRVNVFFPIIFMLMVLIFMTFAISKRSDQLSMPFALASAILCFVLSLMFIAPAEFDTMTTTTTTEIISTPSDDVFTSVKTTENRQVIIPNDSQFRVILSALFSLFGLFSALISILIMFYWKHD